MRADGSGESMSLDSVRGRTAHSILSIADPTAFIRQMEARGIQVEASIFPDHYAFTAAEVERLARGLAMDALVVSTLKDAVKLAPHWPRLAPPLWYVSQHVMVERGVGGIERLLDDVVRARQKTPSTAG